MHNKTFTHFMLYGIFGVLTTLLSWLLYWSATRLLALKPIPASAISWFLAVLFSYTTNRKYVFHSGINTFSGIVRECASFFGSRLGTGIFDLIVTYIFIELLKFYDMPVKIISNIIVIIMNYIFSKILVFKKEKIA